MNFEEVLEDFEIEHPVWTWVLARFVISACICGIVIVAVLGFVTLLVPLVTVEEQGLGGFWVWLWLPLQCTALWCLASLVVEVFERFIR